MKKKMVNACQSLLPELEQIKADIQVIHDDELLTDEEKKLLISEKLKYVQRLLLKTFGAQKGGKFFTKFRGMFSRPQEEEAKAALSDAGIALPPSSTP